MKALSSSFKKLITCRSDIKSHFKSFKADFFQSVIYPDVFLRCSEQFEKFLGYYGFVMENIQ